MISRSTEKFPAFCCGFQLGNERALVTFLFFLTLAAHLCLHLFPLWLLYGCSRFFLSFSLIRRAVNLACVFWYVYGVFAVFLYPFAVSPLPSHFQHDWCNFWWLQRENKVNEELSCISIQSDENKLIWKNWQLFSSFMAFCPPCFQILLNHLHLWEFGDT